MWLLATPVLPLSSSAWPTVPSTPRAGPSTKKAHAGHGLHVGALGSANLSDELRALEERLRVARVVKDLQRQHCTDRLARTHFS